MRRNGNQLASLLSRLWSQVRAFPIGAKIGVGVGVGVSSLVAVRVLCSYLLLALPTPPLTHVTSAQKTSQATRVTSSGTPASRTPTRTTTQTATPRPTPDNSPAVLGGTAAAFTAKYGQPNDRSTQGVLHYARYPDSSAYPGMFHVDAVIIVLGWWGKLATTAERDGCDAQYRLAHLDLPHCTR
jgi:hypothetical protein